MLWRLTSASGILTTPGLITVVGMLTALTDIASAGIAPPGTALAGIALTGIALAGIFLFSERRIICLQLFFLPELTLPSRPRPT
jgi:hypothetical protein